MKKEETKKTEKEELWRTMCKLTLHTTGRWSSSSKNFGQSIFCHQMIWQWRHLKLSSLFCHNYCRRSVDYCHRWQRYGYCECWYPFINDPLAPVDQINILKFGWRCSMFTFQKHYDKSSQILWIISNYSNGVKEFCWCLTVVFHHRKQLADRLCWSASDQSSSTVWVGYRLLQWLLLDGFIIATFSIKRIFFQWIKYLK